MSDVICPVCKETHKIEHMDTEFKNEGEKVELLFKCENCGAIFTESYKMARETVEVQQRYFTVQDLIDALLEIPSHDRTHMPVMVNDTVERTLKRISSVDTSISDRIDLKVE